MRGYLGENYGDRAMKQILVISGKGGTGKTTMTAALGELAGDAVLADCDVDAADLYLLVQPESQRRQPEDFYSGYKFAVDPSWCSACGRCVDVCRFQAITMEHPKSDRPEWKVAKIDPIACEGCGCCADVCPTEAIAAEQALAGKIYHENTRFGPMVYGKLGIAESNSGKMVSTIRKYAAELAEQEGKRYVIIDGSPGIGCPVIASLSGVDVAVMVTEPTCSGLHDLERIIKLCNHFRIPALVLLNKFDINEEMGNKLISRAKELGAEILGTLPFEKRFVEATSEGKTVLEYAPDSEISKKIEHFWKQISS